MVELKPESVGYYRAAAPSTVANFLEFDYYLDSKLVKHYTMITTHRTIGSWKDHFERSGLVTECSSELKNLGSPKGLK